MHQDRRRTVLLLARNHTAFPPVRHSSRDMMQYRAVPCLPLALSVGCCSAATCPELKADRKRPAYVQNDAIDPKRSMSGLPRAIVSLADRPVPTIGPWLVSMYRVLNCSVHHDNLRGRINANILALVS
jgi:hypothetical protein